MNVNFKAAERVDSATQSEIGESLDLRRQAINPYIKLFASLKLLAISFFSIIVLLYLFYSLIMNKEQSVGEKMEIVSKLLTVSAHFGALGDMPNNTLH